MSPQNSYVATLTPKMIVLGDGPSGGDQILRVELSWMGLMPLYETPWASFVVQLVKSLPAVQETHVQSLRKILWRRKWQTTPVFLPRNSHGQRGLMVYHPRGLKESDRSQRLTCHHHEPPQSSPPLSPCEGRGKRHCLWTRRDHTCWSIDLGLLVSKTVKNNWLLFKPFSVCCSVLAARMD